MTIVAGTSGWSYDAWKGTFYPPKIPGSQMLPYYAQRLPAVEVNNTFYRMPSPSLFARWAEATPDGFRFALKSPRRLSHDKRLKDVGDEIARLSEATAHLGNKCGPVLFQLPPYFRCDRGRLADFLRLVTEKAPGISAAFEFRHRSWFEDEVFELLGQHGAALCIADAEDHQTPFVATTGWGYLRLRRPDYTPDALSKWKTQICSQSWSTTYVFLKHEDSGRGPVLAQSLLEAAQSGDPGALRQEKSQ